MEVARRVLENQKRGRVRFKRNIRDLGTSFLSDHKQRKTKLTLPRFDFVGAPFWQLSSRANGMFFLIAHRDHAFGFTWDSLLLFKQPSFGFP